MNQRSHCSKSEAKEWRQDSNPGLSGFPVLQFSQLSDRAARLSPGLVSPGTLLPPSRFTLWSMAPDGHRMGQ